MPAPAMASVCQPSPSIPKRRLQPCRGPRRQPASGGLRRRFAKAFAAASPLLRHAPPPPPEPRDRVAMAASYPSSPPEISATPWPPCWPPCSCRLDPPPRCRRGRCRLALPELATLQVCCASKAVLAASPPRPSDPPPSSCIARFAVAARQLACAVVRRC
ncbi:hypothetical protein ZWY2020_026894 [Hordeum vulgare]|nr:hypothetical protein ZWY2020_026894 [Hordeum vulgare]